jgi:hypothetical protein
MKLLEEVGDIEVSPDQEGVHRAYWKAEEAKFRMEMDERLARYGKKMLLRTH